MPEILTKRDKNDILKQKIALIKPSLASIKNWKTTFIEKHPQYNNKYNLELLSRVVSLRVVDAEMTKLLEVFIEEVKQQKEE